MSNSFIHLNLHSEYSLVDGLVRVKQLISQAAEQGMPAVAITDHCNLFSVVKFYQAAWNAGVKPIIGAEVYIENPQDAELPQVITLLCKDNQGYHNLTALISDAYLTGQTNIGPIISWQQLAAKSNGLIALLGTANNVTSNLTIENCVDKNAAPAKYLQQWQDIFPNSLYLEIQRIGLSNEASYNQALCKFAETMQCPIVASNGVRFLAEDDFEAHEARVCINQGRVLDDASRPRNYTTQQHLRSSAEMCELFADIPQAITNTIEIAKRCNVTLQLGKPCLPNFPIPDGFTTESYLADQSSHGLDARLKILFPGDALTTEIEKQYRERLQIELDVINNMGFPGYFLIVADFIQWAKNNGVPVGPGRGSGAGSLVAYVLGITDLDPLKYDLLFERFLNPERVSMPDFDVDFCMEGRDRVIEYVTEKYGRQAVSQIITYGSMAAKAVVRDVGRVLGHPYGFVDKIAKLIPFELGMTLDKALEQEEDLRTRYEEEDDVRGLIDLARKLEGITRNAGKHAGGVVIAPSKLTDFSPLYCEASGENVVTQFDKDDVEAAGLVKFDFLGLRTLTIINWAVEIINSRRRDKSKDDQALDINLISVEDHKPFELLKACQTTAVFQLESRGMKDLIKRLQPDCFEDIVALVALFRPGPLQSGMVDDFIARKHGRAKVEYPHPDLEPILRPTYGVILYQEQVMQIAQVLAGYTLGGADMLRRAMGKKKPEEMAKQRDIFVKGATKRGVSQTTAAYIFDLMEKFAGYGFNKSHSAAYALVAYQTAWLKYYHPAAFMAAVLSSDMDNTDKVVIFIKECQAMGLTVLPPDINSSEYKFTVSDDKTIRYGLGAIKGVGLSAIELIIDERNQNGEYKSLFDLTRRLDSRKVNRRVLEATIKSGAMDFVEQDRASIFATLEHALKLAEKHHKDEASGQFDLFSELPSEQEDLAKYISVPPWSDSERLQAEKDTLGLYFSGHPVTQYNDEFSHFIIGNIIALESDEENAVVIAGLITSIRTLFTKKGDKMAIVSIEDDTGSIDTTIFSKLYDEKKELLQKDQMLVISGEVGNDDFTGGLRVTARDIWSLSQARARFSQGISMQLQEDNCDNEFMQQLKQILGQYPGTSRVVAKYVKATAKADILFGEPWRVEASEDLVHQLKILCGDDKVLIKY